MNNNIEGKITIADRLSGEFKIYNTILDIGCGNAQYLYDFKKYGFKKAIGVDKMMPNINPVRYYTDHLTEILGISKGDALAMYYDDNSWLKFFGCDFNLYLEKTPNEKYSLIICRNVLHFYPDIEKYNIIQNLYERLEPEGLLYIELNNNSHPDTLTCDHVEGNSYKGFKGYNKVDWHYADEEKFNTETNKFNPINRLYLYNETSLKTVFRKK